MHKRSVSIVTPTYNAVRFVERCIANGLEQGDVVLEHIIVDGGSTDGSIERVLELCAIHPHLRFIPGPDKGQSDALNKGSAAARGNYISILNADDFYEPMALRDMASRLAKEPVPAFVVGDCRVLDHRDDTVFVNKPNDLRLESLLLGFSLSEHPVNPSAYLYHRACHDLIGGYDESDHHSMDLDFLFKAATRTRMRYFPVLWGNFRLIPGAKTYEDAQSAERARLLRKRFADQLPMHRRVRMQAIRLAKLASKARRRLGTARSRG